MDRNLGGILVTRKLNRAENTAQDVKIWNFPESMTGWIKEKLQFREEEI